MTVKLKNSILEVEISSMGAELQSINKNGKEMLWNGDPKFWKGRAPIMFPICGGLKNDSFTYEGKSYTLKKHGYAKLSEFEVESQDDSSATFLLKSNEESKKMYPFDYEFRVKYKIEDNKLLVTFDIENKTNGKMYVSVGSHEGYACPEGIEDYSVIFDKEETIGSYILDGNYLEHNTIPILNGEKELKLKYDYFAVDALCFKDVKSRGATLLNRKTGEKRHVSFEGFDYLFIWTKPGAGYICIEPWCGIPDSVDFEGDLTQKEGINLIEKGKKLVKLHTMEF